jgi:hypothetical protein
MNVHSVGVWYALLEPEVACTSFRPVFELVHFLCKLLFSPEPGLFNLDLVDCVRTVGRRCYLDRDNMSGEQDNSAHERWAKDADVQELLRHMLAFPFVDHSNAVRAVLNGELRTAHVIGLLRVAKSLDFSQAKWKHSASRNKGVAYHTWLYHFLGGAEAKLFPPPASTAANDTQWSVNLRRDALAFEENFKREIDRIEKAIRRANAVDVPGYHTELTELRCQIFDHSVLRAAAPDLMETMEGGGGSSPPPGSDAEWQQQTDALVAFAMGTHARLGEGYAHTEGPCAVRLLAGNIDMLRQIAAWFRGVQPRQLAPPDREQLRLRRLNWQLELELQAERAASSSLAIELVQSQHAAARALEREAAALAKLARGQDSAERMLGQMERGHAAESRQLTQAASELRSEVATERRAHRKELTEVELDRQNELERHEADTIERLRDQEHELREYQQQMFHERNEATAEAADRAVRVEELNAALERLRSSSKNGLLLQVAELQEKVRKLGTRRTLNQRRVGEANLDRRRAIVAQEQAAAARASLGEYGISAEAERAASERADELEKQVNQPAPPHSIPSHPIPSHSIPPRVTRVQHYITGKRDSSRVLTLDLYKGKREQALGGVALESLCLTLNPQTGGLGLT